MDKTILCLFDCEEALESLAMRLSPQFRLVSCSSIHSALQQLTRCNPDLVVVQLHMQDENCFDFFKVARDIVIEREIPMIAISAHEACDQSIESYLKRCCQYFGCREYVGNDDFRSNAFVCQLSKHFQVANCATVSQEASQFESSLSRLARVR